MKPLKDESTGNIKNVALGNCYIYEYIDKDVKDQ